MSSDERLRPWTRIRAWLVTGPLGHLYGALADLLELVARTAAARVRRGPR